MQNLIFLTQHDALMRGAAAFPCSLEVYEATFRRMGHRCERFYERYPGDAKIVWRIAELLLAADRRGASVPLLNGGGMLTCRRFMTSGILLGRSLPRWF